MTALGWLAAAAATRAESGLHRELVARPPGADTMLDLAGNDYLALSRHPLVVEAGVEALRAYGAGSTGSRLVTGTTQLHEQLEHALADFCVAPAALVFSSGYTANLAAVTALSGPGSLVVSSAGNHASLVDACRLSRARVAVVPDDDVGAVRRVLAGRSEQRALVVTDAVFSVTGRLAPLAELHAAARQHGAALVVDEAHALGVVGAGGQGAVVAAGLARYDDVVRTLTLSKALGSQGGAVVGSAAVRAHLVDTARSFVFDTGLAPSSGGAALAALGLVTPQRVADLHANGAALAALLELASSPSAVLSLPIGNPHLASAARDQCAAAGVRVGCFRPPSVPAGRSCLRLTVRADLTPADLGRAAEAVLAAVRVEV
ncbi:MAG: 8-amino-7-oxononanoate synthase [Actinobacteria bacterium]|nr:8-amino-7-oxononanoate synthase [Actinomycetota bacterium]